VYRYSGNRFGELDKVLTKAAGQTFAQLLSERILEPLNLTNTAPNPSRREACAQAHRDPGEFARRLASAYALDGTPLEHPKYFLTAAGLVSTVGDVARFSIALDDGRLLRPETRARAFSPFVSESAVALAYGYGWFIQQRLTTKLVWHYGWGVGNSTLIIKVPERRLTFILLGNSEGLSRKFDMGKDNNVLRSSFARAFLEAFRL
jgi:CubicO group peptidase (beta-lactamase class C family)